jgi:hypothetical protein
MEEAGELGVLGSGGCVQVRVGVGVIEDEDVGDSWDRDRDTIASAEEVVIKEDILEMEGIARWLCSEIGKVILIS